MMRNVYYIQLIFVTYLRIDVHVHILLVLLVLLALLALLGVTQAGTI